MTKASLIALTAVVWTGGFAATGALVRVLHHPTAPPASITYVDTSPAPVALVPQTPQVEERIIVLPTVEIVAKLPRLAPPPPPPPAPTHELRCGVWKPLEQGGGSVQVCE